MKSETPKIAKAEIPTNKIQLPAENEVKNAEKGEVWLGLSKIS